MSIVDPDAPFVFGEIAPEPAERSETQKRVETLHQELKERDSRIQELTASERYWADQVRGAKPATEVQDEDENELPPAAQSPFEGEGPEKFLDDLSVDGLKALRKRGVITKDELAEEIAKAKQEVRAEADQRLEVQRRHNAIDAELNKFPDLKDRNSELLKRTRTHWHQMVADDPKMKESPAAMLSAARIAQKELDMAKKLADTARGERQNYRGSLVGEEDEAGDPLDSPAREVVKNLTQYLDPKDRNPRKAEEVYRSYGKRG